MPLHLVSTSSEVRSLDAHTIHTLGVPGAALMELAGRAVAAELMARHHELAGRGVQVVAGRGNNGGDGYVIARLLHLSGVPVRVLGLAGEHTADCATHRAAAEKLGIEVVEEGPIDGPGLLVDALLGTGLHQDLRGEIAQRVAGLRESGVPVVAVDLPTGLCGDTGRVLGDAAPAVLTVTFGRARVGHFLEPGADLCGALVIADIGLTGDVNATARVADGVWVAEQLPDRAAASHKGSHGHLGVVAGSPECAGAGVLACNAAIRAGAGLVTLFTPRDGWGRLGGLQPEVMVGDTVGLGPERLRDVDAVAVGPGFGTGREQIQLLRRLWRDIPHPAVFDADALAAMTGVFNRPRHLRCVTPHPGEAGRLLSTNSRDVQADRLGAVRRLARIAPALLKGRHTLIAGGDRPITINRTGTAALATAGSGDVLTGLVGALLANGLDAWTALVCGAFVHGYAGELAGPAPIVAGDVVAQLPAALRTVATRTDVLDIRPLL
jgi:ADP-dependent NAD(P)H-hydrate dehydratase / NAD(P)H-hydrate epimerase